MSYLHRLFTVAAAALFIAGNALAQTSGTVSNHAYAIGKGAGTTGYTSLLCGSAQLAVGQSAADPICQTITGDWTISAGGAATLATVNANVGTFGTATQCPTFTVNAKGLIAAANATTCTPAIGSIAGLGTGVATALAVNVGTAGSPVVNGGALGTPSSGVGTNLTGTAAGLTAGNATTAATATNSTITNDTTTNATMFPAWVTANTGNLPLKVTSTKLTFNPSTGILTSTGFAGSGSGLTAIPLTTGVTGTLPVANGGTNYTGGAWTTYTPTLGCGAGTLTTSSATGHSVTIGKLVFYNIDIVVTTNGTCSSFLTATMPSNVGFRSAATGRNNSTGRVVLGTISAGSNVFAMTLDAGTYPITDGQSITANGSYEAQ